MVATRDCYSLNVGATAALGTQVWTREIDYEAYDDEGGYLGGAVIKEKLISVYGRTPPESQSKKGQVFEDQISVGSTGDFSVLQSFTVLFEGFSYAVKIQSAAGAISDSNKIVAKKGYIDINDAANLGSGGSRPLCR